MDTLPEKELAELTAIANGKVDPAIELPKPPGWNVWAERLIFIALAPFIILLGVAGLALGAFGGLCALSLLVARFLVVTVIWGGIELVLKLDERDRRRRLTRPKTPPTIIP